MNEARNTSIIFLVVGFVLLLVLSVASMIPLFVSSQPCPTAVMDCGPSPFPAVGLLMLAVPWLAMIVGAVFTIVALSQGRPSAKPISRAIMIAVGSWIVGLISFIVWPD
jgi:hypothetical protein